MAHVNRKTNLSNVHFWPSLSAKLAVASALCLLVQILLAQAPSSGPLIREEVDGAGHKYQVPLQAYLDPKNKSKLQDRRNEIRRIITSQPSPINDPAIKASLDSFYLQFFFPMMTTEEGMKTIGDERVRFMRDHIVAAKDPAVHSYLINIALTSMTKIVQDKAYRPAVRYNAMYIISSLNDVEPTTVGAAPSLPEPMRTALPFILQQFQKADSDEIKVAALLGLARHLEWDNYKQPPSTPMSPAAKAAAVKALTEFAEGKTVPPLRNPDVHVWMRRRAIEGLGVACLTRSDAEIAATLERLLKDETDEMSIRLTVAATLGRMSLQAPAKIDAVATAKELGYLALVACDTELTRAENRRKSDFEHEARLMGTYSGDLDAAGSAGGIPGMSSGRMPGSGSPDGMGGGGVRPLRPTPGSSAMPGDGYSGELGATVDPSMMDPKHFMVEYLRRKLRQQIYAVQLGLLGGDDKARPKAGTLAPTLPQTPAGGSAAEKKEPRGMYAIAKPGKERTDVDEFYFHVRKLAEVVEGAGAEAEFYQLVKDLRKELKPLEAITKRLPPPGSVPSAAGIPDDAPTIPSPIGKGLPGKGPAKGGPGPAAKPNKTAVRPQPNVFAKPRGGR